MTDAPLFFVSAGEPSSDLHGANLIAGIRKLCPQARFFGLGGPRMAAAGCDLLYDMTRHGSHMALAGPLLQIGHYLKLIGNVDRQLQYRRPDVMVFIDYPGLNFVLASRGRVRHIPTMWYIPPQMWAWASFRVHKTARRLDRLACVFPFSTEFYRNHGVDAKFVGHPLVDHFAAIKLDQQAVEQARPKSGEQVVLLLPGSRKSEIEALLPLYLSVCEIMKRRLPHLRFVMGSLNSDQARMARQIISGSELNIEIFCGKTNELMSVADFALAASGTATLELAWFKTPMMALYPVNQLMYKLLGGLLLTTPHLSLPNAVAGRVIIPEYYLYWGPPEPIAEDAIDILSSPDRSEQMRRDLAGVREKLGQPGASLRAAELALDLIGAPTPDVPWWRCGLFV